MNCSEACLHTTDHPIYSSKIMIIYDFYVSVKEVPVSLGDMVRYGVPPVRNVTIYRHWVENNPPRRFHNRQLFLCNQRFRLLLGFPLIFQVAGLFQARYSLLQKIFLQLRSDIVEAVVLNSGH